MKDYCERFYGQPRMPMFDAITFAEQNLAFKDQSRAVAAAATANVTLGVALNS